jgi:hypothetical protein
MADSMSEAWNGNDDPILPEIKEAIKDCWDRVKRTLTPTGGDSHWPYMVQESKQIMTMQDVMLNIFKS